MNKPTPKIYRTNNWPSCNQALINRGNLAIWFNPDTQGMHNQQANKDEIKPTPMQQFNAAS